MNQKSSNNTPPKKMPKNFYDQEWRQNLSGPLRTLLQVEPSFCSEELFEDDVAKYVSVVSELLQRLIVCCRYFMEQGYEKHVETVLKAFAQCSV